MLQFPLTDSSLYVADSLESPEKAIYKDMMISACLAPEDQVEPLDCSLDSTNTFYMTSTLGKYPKGLTLEEIKGYAVRLKMDMQIPVSNFVSPFASVIVGLQRAALMRTFNKALPDYDKWEHSYSRHLEEAQTSITDVERRGYLAEIALYTRLAYPDTTFATSTLTAANAYMLDFDRVVHFLNEPSVVPEYAIGKLRVLACMRLLAPEQYSKIGYQVDWQAIYKHYSESSDDGKPSYLFYSRIILADKVKITDSGLIETELSPLNPKESPEGIPVVSLE